MIDSKELVEFLYFGYGNQLSVVEALSRIVKKRPELDELFDEGIDEARIVLTFLSCIKDRSKYDIIDFIVKEKVGNGEKNMENTMILKEFISDFTFEIYKRMEQFYEEHSDYVENKVEHDKETFVDEIYDIFLNNISKAIKSKYIENLDDLDTFIKEELVLEPWS